MMVLILERVSPGLRGELSRWMLEPRANVFVGQVNAMVRDKLWDKVRTDAKDGAAIMLHHADTEQGYRISTWGDPSRTIEDFEGLQLVRIHPSRRV